MQFLIDSGLLQVTSYDVVVLPVIKENVKIYVNHFS